MLYEDLYGKNSKGNTKNGIEDLYSLSSSILAVHWLRGERGFNFLGLFEMFVLLMKFE